MKEIINFEHFSKLDIRIGSIREAEAVEGSQKLIILLVDVGEKEDIQLVAGIGNSYNPADLEGRQVAVLVNLEPRMIMGHRSQGMILASEGGEGPVIISPLSPVEPGSRVS